MSRSSLAVVLLVASACSSNPPPAEVVPSASVAPSASAAPSTWTPIASTPSVAGPAGYPLPADARPAAEGGHFAVDRARSRVQEDLYNLMRTEGWTIESEATREGVTAWTVSKGGTVVDVRLGGDDAHADVAVVPRWRVGNLNRDLGGRPE